MKKLKMLKWAKFLESVPPEKFDMGSWGDSDKKIISVPRCATKACALGWATAIPEFNKAGLELIADFRGSRFGTVFYKGQRADEACMAFFGVTKAQARNLVYHGSDTPKEKAEEIRAMVRAAE